MAQKCLAHPRGRVQRVAARQRSADMPRGHSVADCLRQGAHVLHIARPNHEQNHFPFIDIGDRGLGVRPRVAQNRLKDVRSFSRSSAVSPLMIHMELMEATST